MSGHSTAKSYTNLVCRRYMHTYSHTGMQAYSDNRLERNRILRELFLTCYYEPGGDKYLVAKKWGNIHIVDRRWVDQSVARRAYLDESAYVIGQNSFNYNGIKGSLKEQRNPEMSGASFQSVPAVSVDDSVSMSQYVPVSSGYASTICTTDIVGAPCVQETNEMPVESHVAEDSEAEDDDLYLSNCRISLVGFEEKELSREKKEVRRLAAWGVINVVKAKWLEDCNKIKTEVKVSTAHLASELLSKEFPFVGMEKSAATRETKAAKSSHGIFHVPTVSDSHDKQLAKDPSSERKPAKGKHENMNNARAATRSAKSSQQNGLTSTGKATSAANSQRSTSSNIFEGRTFCFSNSFSHDRVGHLQDVGSHPIFSPLRCRIPLPGFEDFRFCVSQYDEKDRVLLKNLCLTLGAKFTEKASKRVSHLICKFASGPKYEAYHNKRIPTITIEWLFECVRQDTIMPYDQFQPKPPTSQDKDAGMCIVSQFPTQAANTTSKFDCPEPLSEPQVPRSSSKHSSGSSISEEKIASSVSKRRRSETAKANDTSTNIGRTEKHSDSSSALGVADSIKDFEDLLVQSSRDPALDASVVGQDEEPQPVPDNAFTSLYNDMKTRSNNWPQKQHMPPGKNVKSPDSTRAPVPTPYLPFSETQTDSQVRIVPYNQHFPPWQVTTGMTAQVM
ncbi:unnamed protein product [Triticum turgidum subsp. durum]|uniref:BRCT domain-containing protein n=1 Tax=Triticum turgidum subsp. durum TaxID=4567 RepID=A0A9R0W027_TRITD|nr:unnamed protein product [Triticum turgidum subsp. durum]